MENIVHVSPEEFNASVTPSLKEPNPADSYNSRLFKKRDNLKQGNFNVLPFPFKRASYYFPGVEKPTYVNISAETKVGKTSFASFAFIFEQLWMAYHNPKLKVRYLYINAEESSTRIKDRIVSYLLYKYTNREIRIGYRDLNSATVPLPDNVAAVLQDDGFIDIRDFFFNNIEFADETYPTGISIAIKKFAEKHGEIIKGNSFETTNNLTGKKTVCQTTVGYKQKDPNEFLIVFMDNLNNVTPESGQTLLQAITAVSKNFKDIRNKLGLIIIALQQQNAEADTMDAFKLQRVEPKVTSLADCKQTARDLNIAIGIFSPVMKFSGLADGDPRKRDYKGYNLTKFGDYFRTVNIMVDRDGESSKAFPMFFDGVVNVWEELPKTTDTVALNNYYTLIDNIKAEEDRNKTFKELYKQNNGLNTSFIICSKEIYNRVARTSIVQYLCMQFKKLWQ